MNDLEQLIAQTILLWEDGVEELEIARQLNVHTDDVNQILERYTIEQELDYFDRDTSDMDHMDMPFLHESVN